MRKNKIDTHCTFNQPIIPHVSISFFMAVTPPSCGIIVYKNVDLKAFSFFFQVRILTKDDHDYQARH